MILRRLRLRAGVYVSAMFLLVGLTLAAMANEPITRSQAESMIDARVAAAGLAVVAAFWILLMTFMGRVERAVSTATAVALAAALKAHDEAPLAHSAASEHNHGPMNAQSDRIEEKLDALILEHRIIRGTEDEVCSVIRSLAKQKRDPKESPHARRRDDPPEFDARRDDIRGSTKPDGTDATPLRGKQ